MTPGEIPASLPGTLRPRAAKGGICPVRSSAEADGDYAAPMPGEGHDEPVATQGERALWRAVIVQALMDAACGSRKPEAEQIRHDAMIWLRGKSRDFATVAHYAGFDPEYLRGMIRKSLENNCQWRARPGEGTRIRRYRPRSGRKPRQRR